MPTAIIIDDVQFFLGRVADKAGVDPNDLVEVNLVLGDGRTVHIEVPARVHKDYLDKHEWLTRQQVQDLLQLSRATVEKLFKSGELSALKVGRQWRVRNADLKHFLKTHRVQEDAEQ
jgi:excisionase family DNA binding protein